MSSVLLFAAAVFAGVNEVFDLTHDEDFETDLARRMSIRPQNRIRSFGRGEKKCSGDMVYSTCHSECPKICGEPEAEMCIMSCRMGCGCQGNLWQSGDRCVTKDQCPGTQPVGPSLSVSSVGSCVVNGEVIPNNSMGPSPFDDCNLCKCRNGRMTRRCTRKRCATSGILTVSSVDKVWSDCHTACPKKCGQPASEMCIFMCVQGMGCPSTHPWETFEGKCVAKRKQCPIRNARDGEGEADDAVATECPKRKCRMNCPDGFVQDDNGCDTCQCAEPACPPAMCMLFCMNGFEKDPETGCDLCKCARKPKCPKKQCKMLCADGFVKDPETGCDTCQCKDAPVPIAPVCEPVMCKMLCADGYEKDEDGCDTCQCAEPSVYEVIPIDSTCKPCKAKIHCENGFETDDNGCDTCQCKDAPATKDARVSPTPPPGHEPAIYLPVTCPLPRCRMYCGNGYMLDSNGCQTCQCNPICPPVMCMMYCEHGFVQDDNGCDTCSCKRNPVCPPAMCDMFCDHGFVQDSRGCDLCKCNPNPLLLG